MRDIETMMTTEWNHSVPSTVGCSSRDVASSIRHMFNLDTRLSILRHSLHPPSMISGLRVGVKLVHVVFHVLSTIHRYNIIVSFTIILIHRCFRDTDALWRGDESLVVVEIRFPVVHSQSKFRRADSLFSLSAVFCQNIVPSGNARLHNLQTR